MADEKKAAPMTTADIVKAQALPEYADGAGGNHSDLVEIKIEKDTTTGYKKGDVDYVHPTLAALFKELGIISNLGKPYTRPELKQKDITIDV